MNHSKRSRAAGSLSLVLLAYVAFIALGMPDSLLGIAWPSMRADFGVPLDMLGTLLIGTVTGYTISTFMSGAMVARLGMGNLLALSCMLTGLGLFGYTLVPEWWMMVALGVVAGLGAGAIDAGLNTYAAAHFREGLVQWLHASYGIGVTLGPIIMTVALTNFDSWRAGYRIVAAFQILMAVAFLFTLSWWDDNQTAETVEKREKRLTDYNTPMGVTMRQPRVWLSMLMFFFYVGGEVSLGTWAYSLLTEARGIQPAAAGLIAGGYWGMFTLGRILAGLYAGRLGVNTLVQGGVILALLGSLLLWWNPFELSNLLAVGMIGLAVAPVFPAMISGTHRRVGDQFAANTIGMQMAVTGLGASLVPGFMGVLARRFSLEIIPICLVLIFLILYGLYRLAMTAKYENEPQSAA